MRLYKTLGRLERETVHSGQYTLYGYDDRDRLISLDHKKSDNSVISAEDYEYDDADNLVEKTMDSVVTTYEYDYIDQLLSES